jgi:hypothetical protein
MMWRLNAGANTVARARSCMTLPSLKKIPDIYGTTSKFCLESSFSSELLFPFASIAALAPSPSRVNECFITLVKFHGTMPLPSYSQTTSGFRPPCPFLDHLAPGRSLALSPRMAKGMVPVSPTGT